MEVLEALKAAKNSGCKVYKVEKYDSWGYIVTPNNNILVINKSQWGAGVTFSFEYIPSQSTGSGCACMEGDEHDFGITEINPDTIANYENQGLQFARRLKAKFFNSPQEFFDRSYWKKELIEL